MSGIKDKRYFDALNNYTGEVLYVEINYDEGARVQDRTARKEVLTLTCVVFA